MRKISFSKKLITCVLAAWIVGATTLRMGVTYFRSWLSIGQMAIIPFVFVSASVIYVLIWQLRKTNNPATLAFWQGLIRYGVAFDLAAFGWEKIFHLQLVMPQSKLDMPYSSFSPSDIFWTFYSHSYLFGCIIAGLQIVGAMLLLFRRTTLVGIFILLPVLANILMMDVFYKIGSSVVVHASIMMAGVIYFLVIEFNRLKAFFFAANNQLLPVHLSRFLKMCIRLSVVYIPLLLIAMHGKPDKHPDLTGKYEVKQINVVPHLHYQESFADSTLAVVYFDIKNGCVFQFGSPQQRWNGSYSKENDHLTINWREPADEPPFSGSLSQTGNAGTFVLKGMLGADSMTLILQKASL